MVCLWKVFRLKNFISFDKLKIFVYCMMIAEIAGATILAEVAKQELPCEHLWKTRNN